jgi:hypothetical protein
MMKLTTVGAAIAMVVLLAGTAMAAPILIFENGDTASVSNPAPAGSYALGPLGAVGGIGGPRPFALPFSGQFTLGVADCCLVGDVYQAFVDGHSLGFTSSVPVGGPTLSTGTFSLFLTAGPHTYDINDTLLSSIGFASPFGGGIVPGFYSPAGLTDTGTLEAVPEPTTLLLFGTTMAGLGLAARWRRRRQK